MALVLGEAIVRVFAPTETMSRFNEDFQGLKAVRPNVHGFHQIPDTFRKEYSTSAQRFRGQRMYAQSPAPATLRIAVLGDSFTFGWGATDDETYPGNLERILSHDIGAVEVINAGALGDGTGDEALWYDAWVSNFHSQLVVLTVVPNDTDDDLDRTLFEVSPSGEAEPLSRERLQHYRPSQNGIARIIHAIPGFEYLAEHSQLMNLFRRVVSLKIRDRRIDRWQTAKDGHPFETVGLPLLAGEVAWLNRRVQQSGARLAVVFVPFRETIYPDSRVPKPEIDKAGEMIATLAQVCAREKIPFHDTTSEMKAEAAAGKVPLYYMSDYDAHPTPAGYRAIAQNVAAFIVSQFQFKQTSR